MYSTPLCLISV